MVVKEIREGLPEGALLFDNPAYDNSIIGVSNDDRAIYDYDKMVSELMKDQDWTEDEAIEWVDYNSLRALSYISEEKKPIVCFSFEW